MSDEHRRSVDSIESCNDEVFHAVAIVAIYNKLLEFMVELVLYR